MSSTSPGNQTKRTQPKKSSRKRPLKASPSPSRRTTVRERLESTCRIEAVRPLIEDLGGRVIGQDEAIDNLSCSFSRLLSGLRDPGRPLLTALLLGPTGVGKTETSKSLAQTLFGSERAMTRVNCEEYAHGHEISKLLGSPPGYVGSNIEPLLSQAEIDEPHRPLRETLMTRPDQPPGLAERISDHEGRHVSVILFDEVEKAHPILWNALLGILEDGMLTLGDNSTTDFTRSIVLMTSNVGSSEMGELLDARPVVGFSTESKPEQALAAGVREVAVKAAEQAFPLEFMNRFDEVLAYSALEPEHLWQIFDKFLVDIHARALHQAGIPLLIKVSDEAKSRIIEKGTDLRFGARPLRRAVERELVDPLSRFIASCQVELGDVIEVEAESGGLAFYRKQRSTGELIAS